MRFSSKTAILLMSGAVLCSAELSSYLTGTFPGGYTGPGPALTWKNNTRDRFDREGVRFSTGGFFWKDFTGSSEAKNDSLGDIEGDGSNWQQLILRPVDSRIVFPRADTIQPGEGLQFGWYLTVPAGKDGTVKEVYPLIKTGAKDELQEIFKDTTTVSLGNLSSVTANGSYYDANYRYIDTGSVKVGKLGAAIFDNFNGETQVMLPMNSKSFTVNNVEGTISPQYTTPLYWMSMIAAQEYFNIDFQFLSGIFAKETDVGRAAYLVRGFWDNTDKAYGCGEVENTTFATLCIAYPQLWIDHHERLSKIRSVNEMETAPGLSASDIASYYMGPDKYTLESPYVVNSVVASAHVFFWYWDILNYSEQPCLKNVLEQHADPYFMTALMALLYNRGMYDPSSASYRDQVIWRDSYKNNLDIDAVTRLNTGFANYREEILTGLFAMQNAEKECITDKTIPLYDTLLTLDMIKKFFYGEGGSAATQGTGGFLKHFAPNRTAFDSDLTTAYNTLAAHWGNKGISFRYDFITLLRVLKPYINYHRARPTDSETQGYIGYRRITDGDCGCDGDTIDHTYPYMDRSASKVAGDFVFQLTATDNKSVRTVEWSVDSYWENWTKGTLINPATKTYECTVPAAELGSADSVWVRVTDGAGNSIIRTVAVENKGEVANVELKPQVTSAVRLTVNAKAIRLTHDLSGSQSLKLDLYDIRGRQIASLFNGTVPASGTSIALPNSLGAGFYIVKMVQGNQIQTVRFQKM